MLEIKAGAAGSGMSVLEFVASVTASIAWPLAAFGIAFLFRNQIRALLQRIKEVEFGGAKATIVPELLDKAEKTAQVISAEETPAAGQQGAEQPQANELGPEMPIYSTNFDKWLNESPPAAILFRFGQITELLERLATKYSIPRERRNVIPSALAKLLYREGAFPVEVLSLINELQEVRNRVAHGQTVSLVDAIRFNEVAAKVAEALIRYGNEPPRIVSG